MKSLVGVYCMSIKLHNKQTNRPRHPSQEIIYISPLFLPPAPSYLSPMEIKSLDFPPEKFGNFLQIQEKNLNWSSSSSFLFFFASIMFLPMPASIAAWVFRWIFSSPPSHLLHFRQLQAVQCPENCPLLSGELSTDSRQSSDSYFSSVQSSPRPDIKLAQIWLTNKSQSNTLHGNGRSSVNMHATELCEISKDGHDNCASFEM